MQELKTEETVQKVIDAIIDFGDGLLEFETKDIQVVLNQLELQENYNDMLVRELEELKKENKELHFKNDVLEDICLQHQNLTQWIEEEIDNEPDTRIFEVSHDFLENLYERVHKLNHEPY